MDCKTCKEKSRQADIPISRYAYESAMSTFERVIRRLWIVIIILIVLLAASNGAWIWYESQFEYVSETTTFDVEQDADGNGINRFVGGDYYGTSESQGNQNEEEPSP